MNADVDSDSQIKSEVADDDVIRFKYNNPSFGFGEKLILDSENYQHYNEKIKITIHLDKTDRISYYHQDCSEELDMRISKAD